MTTVVLGSASPSRLSILRSGGIEPLVVVSTADEDKLKDSLPAGPELVQELARCKARNVAGRLPTEHPKAAADALVIGSDSMLLTESGDLIGKPLTVTNTIKHWQKVRGTTAQLITGHTLIRVTAGVVEEHGAQSSNYPHAEAVSSTKLFFGTPDDRDIERYARTGEPLYCAGGFTLEALGGWFIDRIEGDPSNVIGLSLPTVRRLAAELGVAATELWNIAPEMGDDQQVN
ncbi:MAG: nucleoside triphosphate pyrophosphatase [Lawsonella sp.]|nr:septum formation inhibitor Maf [Mycobacteriales bacterium]